MATVFSAPSDESVDRPDGNAARVHRALPSHGDDRSERPRRTPLELIPRRHHARSTPTERRGSPHHYALDQIVSVRSETAIYYRHLQRHLQGRREPDRGDQYPVSTEAPSYTPASPSGRAELHRNAGAARNRQSDARGHCRIYCRRGLFDETQEIQDRIRGRTEAMLGEKMMERT